MTDSQKNYYEWLCDSVTGNHHRNYTQLLAKLWDKEFYSLLPNDDNRGEDGKNLRHFYCTEVDYRLSAKDKYDEVVEGLGPCRCLEMIIALSKRIEDELYGSTYNKTFQDMFWEIMKNLNLLYYDNRHFDSAGQNKVNWTLDFWLDRKYGRDGVGGLFPIARPLKNQSKVEVWYQMMAYLDVNYPI